MNFGETVGYLFNAFCWFIGVCFLIYSVLTTSRSAWRQLKRGIVEEGLDIQRATTRKFAGEVER